MKFIKRHLTEAEVIWLQSRLFQDHWGNTNFSVYDPIVINETEDVFIVCPGGGGKDNEPDTYIFCYYGVFISFEGRFVLENDLTHVNFFIEHISLLVNAVNIADTNILKKDA